MTRLLQNAKKVVGGLVLLGSVTAFADIAILPDAVLEAIDARFPGAVILEAEADTDLGFEYLEYKVEICFEGTEYDLEIDPDGFVTDVDAEGPCLEW